MSPTPSSIAVSVTPRMEHGSDDFVSEIVEPWIEKLTAPYFRLEIRCAGNREFVVPSRLMRSSRHRGLHNKRVIVENDLPLFVVYLFASQYDDVTGKVQPTRLSYEEAATRAVKGGLRVIMDCSHHVDVLNAPVMYHLVAYWLAQELGLRIARGIGQRVRQYAQKTKNEKLNPGAPEIPLRWSYYDAASDSAKAAHVEKIEELMRASFSHVPASSPHHVSMRRIEEWRPSTRAPATRYVNLFSRCFGVTSEA